MTLEVRDQGELRKAGQDARDEGTGKFRLSLTTIVRLAVIGLTTTWLALGGSAWAQFTDTKAGLPGVNLSSVAWCDYDMDGDLDFLLSGSTGTTRIGRIYRNNGDGTFIDIAAGLPGFSNGSVAWGDYDGDGDQDLLIAGYTGSLRFSRVYRNNGDGTFTDVVAGLPGTNSGSIAWGDYDGDGDLDILLTGSTGAVRIARIYRNDLQAGGTRSFVDIGAALAGVDNSCGVWGDYDGDGKLDILLSGYTGAATICRIYRNNGGGVFSDINAGLPGTTYMSVAWGDYDGDGDLDPLLTGLISGTTRISRIYRNNGNGTFTDIAAGLPGVDHGSVAWGDCDGDGNLDILLAGWTGSTRIARIYLNNGQGTFTDSGAVLPGIDTGSLAWGDCDHDGDLDILLTGNTDSARIAAVYRNDQAHNAPPIANAGGGYVVESVGAGTRIRLNGTASTDPDGDPLIYQWSSNCPAASWDDPTSATPTLTLNTGQKAVYEITLMAADYPAGLISVSTTTLTVTDSTPPVIELIGDSEMTLECHVDVYQEPGARVYDSCDMALTAAVIGGAAVDVNTPGVYVVTYDATDASGNQANQVTRTVKVVDTRPPIITCPADITLEPISPAGNVVSYAPVAKDLCDPPPKVVCNPPSGSTFLPGTTTTVMCTASDAAGNSAQKSFTVRILAVKDVVQNLLTTVNTLAVNGGLTGSLEAVQSSIMRGQLNAASGQIQGFMAKVSAFIGNGRLSPEVGRALLDSATHIQASLKPGAR